MGGRRERAAGGQAAVEAIAVGVLVALLLAAVTAWLVREAGAPAGPPPVLDALARPLLGPGSPSSLVSPIAAPFGAIRGRDDEPIGRALRAAGAGARDAANLAVATRLAFDRAFLTRLGERGAELLEDPLGVVRGAPERSLLDPEEAARRALWNADRLWRYARDLRAMPARRAALRAAEDAGRVTADGVAEAAGIRLRARVLRRPPPRPSGGARRP